MSLTVTIETENAAFSDEEGGPGEECASILRHVARLLEEDFTSGPLHDSNGNTVGSWDLNA